MAELSKGIGLSGFGTEMTGGINYLLVIAIDAYQYLPRLYNCKKDAEAFIDLLLKNYQFEETYIIRVFDEEATEDGIHVAFRNLVQKVTPKDNLIVYFSGHGEYDPLVKEGYWIPVGAQQGSWKDYFPNDTVRRYLGSINSHHTFLISDSCFSGALFEEGTGKSGGSRSEHDPSRWGLTAGRKEIVSDGKPGMHSPFADALLYRLRHNQGSLGVQKLCAEVLEQVEANAWQSPIGEPLRVQGHKNGQFFFHPKRDEASAWQAALSANSVQALLDFEAEFPESEWADSGEIDQRIETLEDESLWQGAKRSNTVSGYREYLHRTRLGKYRLEANEAIAGFRKKEEEEPKRRRAAEERSRKEGEQQPRKEQLVVAPFNWSRFKLPLAVVAATIVIAIVIWQVTKPSKQPAVWDCTRQYDQCQEQGDYYLVQKGQLWGFADRAGNEFIAPRFQEVHPFDSTSGLALVKEKDKYGWIDRQGKTKIAFDFDLAKTFAAGKAEVKKGEETFFIDASGIRLNEPEVATASPGTGKPEEGPKESAPPPPVQKKNEPVKRTPKPSEPSVSFSPPVMVFVRGGTFWMGCTDEQGSDCHDWEYKLQVAVSDFKIGQYEVTQAEWKAIMGNNPSNFKDCDQCPVEQVSLYDVQEFIKKLNQKTGGNYRLPTEAEWEYAARGGQKSQQNKFAGSQNLDAVGWYGGNSGSKTHPVGKKSPNELGIYDMSGNVWEWCARDHSPGSQPNPPDYSGEYYMIRSGSWGHPEKGCRVSSRILYAPGYLSSMIGFRLAQD